MNELLAGLFPFRKYIEVRVRGSVLIVILDGREYRFRSTLLPREAFRISRVAIRKRYRSMKELRNKALKRLKEKVEKEPKKAYRLIKRLLEIRKSGAFRAALKRLVSDVMLEVGRYPRRYYRRAFRVTIIKAARLLGADPEEVYIELLDERPKGYYSYDILYSPIDIITAYLNEKENALGFEFLGKIVIVKAPRRTF